MKHLGARRSTPPAKRADRFFPVRLRIVVPPFGFGMKYAEMDHWLKERAGQRNYFIAGGAGGGKVGSPREDFSAFHFLDMQAAGAFMERFKEFARLAVGVDNDRPD